MAQYSRVARKVLLNINKTNNNVIAVISQICQCDVKERRISLNDDFTVTVLVSCSWIHFAMCSTFCRRKIM